MFNNVKAATCRIIMHFLSLSFIHFMVLKIFQSAMSMATSEEMLTNNCKDEFILKTYW